MIFWPILERQYVPSRMVVSAAGAIRHDDLVRHARDKFGSLDRVREKMARRRNSSVAYADPIAVCTKSSVVWFCKPVVQ